MFYSSPVGHRYVDRGDIDTHDFFGSDFIKDNTWRDLDLSGIIPKGTVLVIMRGAIVATEIDNYLDFRTKGNAYSVNMSVLNTYVANQYNDGMYLVKPDKNGFVQYKAAAALKDSTVVIVNGWWV